MIIPTYHITLVMVSMIFDTKFYITDVCSHMWLVRHGMYNVIGLLCCMLSDWFVKYHVTWHVIGRCYGCVMGLLMMCTIWLVGYVMCYNIDLLCDRLVLGLCDWFCNTTHYLIGSLCYVLCDWFIMLYTLWLVHYCYLVRDWFIMLRAMWLVAVRAVSAAASTHFKRYYFGTIKVHKCDVTLSMLTSHGLPPDLLAIKRSLSIPLIRFEDAKVELGKKKQCF